LKWVKITLLINAFCFSVHTAAEMFVGKSGRHEKVPLWCPQCYFWDYVYPGVTPEKLVD